LARRRD